MSDSEASIIRLMVAFDRRHPDHRPWEQIVADVRAKVDLVERPQWRHADGSVRTDHMDTREGDYFGRTVNVAARIADYARPDEVLVSDEVKKRSELAEVDFQPVGPVVLKGLKEELTLYAATRRGA